MLKSPIQLSSSVRDMDGIPIALANTIDGGSAVVVWKIFNYPRWVFFYQEKL